MTTNIAAKGLFERERQIDASLIDLLGHVNNVRWLDLVVALAVDHSLSLGYDFDRLRALGGNWIVRRHEIDYVEPAFLDQTILERTWIEKMTAACCFRAYEFHDTESGNLLVHARSEWVFVTPAGKPIRIPAEVRKSYVGPTA